MSALIFDIETVGEEFDTLDETTQHLLTRWLKKEYNKEPEYAQELEDLKNGLGFSPLTGQIVAIGVLDEATNTGGVYFQAPETPLEEWDQDGIIFRTLSEKEMLLKFWKLASTVKEFVSFNGRGFDAPFLMIRSAIHKIRPTKDLMANRYLSSQPFTAKHIDLMDQLSFYGSVRRKGSLHLYSRAFGIKSPKAEGITGDDVSRLFKEHRYKDIALYNVADLRATMELYKYWKEFLHFA